MENYIAQMALKTFQIHLEHYRYFREQSTDSVKITDLIGLDFRKMSLKYIAKLPTL